MLTNLSTVLRQKGLLTFSQEESLIEQVKASGISMPEALLSSGLFTSSELAEHLSSLFGLSQPELSQYEYASLCQQLGLRELITRHNALPLHRTPSTLLLAVADPTNQQAEDDFRFATGLQVELVLADFRQLSAAIRRLYGRAIGQERSQLKEINQEELASLVDVGADEIDNIEDLSQD
ncbi:type IV-A pilus assembly ATPase PilB, partial [Vibrio parahaemolyticus]